MALRCRRTGYGIGRRRSYRRSIFFSKYPVGDDQSKGQRNEHWNQQIDFITILDRPAELEADVTIGGVVSVESQRFVSQEGEQEVKRDQNDTAIKRPDGFDGEIKQQAGSNNQIAPQYIPGIGPVFKRVSGKIRMGVEILARSHFCPSCVNAQSQYGQYQIDDPDAKIFTCGPRERDLKALAWGVDDPRRVWISVGVFCGVPVSRIRWIHVFSSTIDRCALCEVCIENTMNFPRLPGQPMAKGYQ